MTKKIESLTEAQVAKFPEYVKKWTDIGLSTEPANRVEAEKGIRLAYEIAGLKAPVIVWCGSPLSNGLVRAVLYEIKNKQDLQDFIGKKVRASVWASVWDSVWASVRASVWDSVGDSVRASVWDSVGDSVRASVWDSVGDSVGDSVWDSVRASVRDSVWASVRASVRASVWDSVWASVRASVWDSVWASVWDSVWASVRDSCYGQHDANWLGFYDYFKEQLNLTKQTEKLSGLWQVAQHAGWFLPHEKICFISERPNKLKRDDRGRLHCEDGMAISYPDGWGIYVWHGVRIPAEWIENKAALTPEIALTWPNIEQRRAACEIIGWSNILKQLKAKTIDKDPNPQIGELLEVELPDIGRERFLRVLCGTGREFAIPVSLYEYNTARECNAATYGWTPNQPIENFIPTIRT